MCLLSIFRADLHAAPPPRKPRPNRPFQTLLMPFVDPQAASLTSGPNDLAVLAEFRQLANGPAFTNRVLVPFFLQYSVFLPLL